MDRRIIENIEKEYIVPFKSFVTALRSDKRDFHKSHYTSNYTRIPRRMSVKRRPFKILEGHNSSQEASSLCRLLHGV